MSGNRQPLPPKKRLDAIEWAANQQGMSYGKFVITLTEQDKRRIYDEYEAMLLPQRQGESISEKNWC